MQQNYSLDIESGGTDPGSAIFSIGICVDTSQDVCHVALPITVQNKMGLSIDNETMLWHGRSNPNWETLRTAITECPQTLVYLADQLDKVADYFNATADVNYSTRRIWMKSPKFDSVLLQDVYKRLGMGLPWSYKEEADVRTIVDLAMEASPNSALPIPPANAHDALADAQYQRALVLSCRTLLL